MILWILSVFITIAIIIIAYGFYNLIHRELAPDKRGFLGSLIKNASISCVISSTFLVLYLFNREYTDSMMSRLVEAASPNLQMLNINSDQVMLYAIIIIASFCIGTILAKLR